jgi:hypothetical protein
LQPAHGGTTSVRVCLAETVLPSPLGLQARKLASWASLDASQHEVATTAPVVIAREHCTHVRECSLGAANHHPKISSADPSSGSHP